MVVYFRVISYVLLDIFAKSLCSHTFHKKLEPFCVSPHGVRVHFSLKPSSTVFAHALMGGLTVMSNIMFFKFALEVAMVRAFFTEEASFIMRIHVVRESAG